jgi:hypothetical protein
LNRQEFLASYLPENVPVSVAYGAMCHFLALHFNEVGGTSEVADFIRSIACGEMGHPTSDVIFDRFKGAVVDADRLEMVQPLRGPK